jgi:alpha-glucosidase
VTLLLNFFVIPRFYIPVTKTYMTQLLVHYPFHIPQLGRDRAIRVLLPKNYHKETNRRYLVLYLQDGQNLFDPATAAFRHWRLREYMNRQPLNRQAILVGIDHGGPDRMQEYAPFKKGRRGGQGVAYLQFIEHTLKPFIDREYRTWGHREATGIVGASLGGLITLYAGLHFSHVFGKAGAFSPSLWFNPDVLKQPDASLKSQLYVAGSKTEMRSMAPTLERVYWSLKGSGYADDQMRVVIRDRGAHSEVFWAREFKQMYEWLFPVTAF